MAKAILTIRPDEDAENPLEGSDWRVVNFLNRDTIKNTIGLQKKLKSGTAFMLKCYRHSCEIWSLMAEDPGRVYHHDAWDTSRNAGILLFEGKTKWLPKTYEERRAMAQATIDTYSSWVNGGAVGWVLELEEGCNLGGSHHTVVDSCWGYYDVKDALADAEAMAKHHGLEVERAKDGF